jgi:hypothetical protein
MSTNDGEIARAELRSEEAIAALERLEAERDRYRDALERILAAPLRKGKWYGEHDSPRIIARLALARDRPTEA